MKNKEGYEYMNTKKQKASSIAITFYVIAVLMLIVMAFEIYMTQKSLSAQMEQAGITFADEWMTIVFGYYFSAQNLLPLVSALLFYGIGHIINKLQFTQDALMACLGETETETKEAEEKEELNLEELAAERKKTQAAKEAKQAEETKEASEQSSADTKEVVKEEAKVEEPKKKKSNTKKKTAKKDEGKTEPKEEKVEETKEEVKTEESKEAETTSVEVKAEESVETKEEVKEAVKEETKA